MGYGTVAADTISIGQSGTNTHFPGNVGIGTTGPSAPLTVSRNTSAFLANSNAVLAPILHVGQVDGTRTVVALDSYGANGPYLLFRHAQGTAAAPTAVLSGGLLALIQSEGYNGSAFGLANGPAILFSAEENWSTTANGSRITFSTKANGTTTTAERMRIQNNGNVGIGSTVPGAKLEVAGNINSSTGALQTAGVTRIANDGVGTFAAGTTIGGAAVSAAVVDKTLASGRLTLTSGTPVTTSDVTAATTVYYTPYDGDVISLYDGSSTWTTLTFSELSLALTSYTANTNYDIWAYNNSGTVALESTAWTNNTTRATTIVQQNGVWVKSGATTRRLLGTIRITGTTGQTEDSNTKRFVNNLDNRKDRKFYRELSWGITSPYSNVYWNNDSTQIFEFVNCMDLDLIDFTSVTSGNHVWTIHMSLMGLDSISSSEQINSVVYTGGVYPTTFANSQSIAIMKKYAGIGKHFIGLGANWAGRVDEAWYGGYMYGKAIGSIKG